MTKNLVFGAQIWDFGPNWGGGAAAPPAPPASSPMMACRERSQRSLQQHPCRAAASRQRKLPAISTDGQHHIWRTCKTCYYKKCTRLRIPLSVEEKLAITLRYLATGESRHTGVHTPNSSNNHHFHITPISRDYWLSSAILGIRLISLLMLKRNVARNPSQKGFEQHCVSTLKGLSTSPFIAAQHCACVYIFNHRAMLLSIALGSTLRATLRAMLKM